MKRLALVAELEETHRQLREAKRLLRVSVEKHAEYVTATEARLGAIETKTAQVMADAAAADKMAESIRRQTDALIKELDAQRELAIRANLREAKRTQALMATADDVGAMSADVLLMRAEADRTWFRLSAALDAMPAEERALAENAHRRFVGIFVHLVDTFSRVVTAPVFVELDDAERRVREGASK